MFNSVTRVLLSSLAVIVSLGQQPDRFAEIFDRGLAKQKTLHSIEARFTETTTSTLLLKPLVARGTVVAAAPGRVRMTYTEPERKIVVMDGKTLTVFWPDRSERQQINMSEIQKNIDHYFASASLKELRSMFAITAAADAARPEIDRVQMRPTRKPIKDGLQDLELWIDRKTDLLAQMRMTFPGGDQKTIALENVSVNVPVTDDMFRIVK